MASLKFHFERPPRSILVILPTWVGDFVMATPFLRALRARFAQAHVTLLAEPNLRDLIRGGDWMDEVLEWPDKKRRSWFHLEYRAWVHELRARRFDWAVLLPNSFRSAWLAFRIGAKRRIGYDRDGRGWLLTDRLPVRNRRNGRFIPVPLVDYYADLAQALGCDPPGDRLELFTTPEDEASVARKLAERGVDVDKPRVVICPGAKYGAAKCWFPDRFAAAADRMIREWNAVAIVTCGPGEETIAQAVGAASTFLNRGLHVFDRPRFTLGELKSLIRRADLVLCNDAGLRHFAKAFDVPVVTVFGPTHPEWTRTSHPRERIARIDVDCGPCQRRTCPLGHLKCMTGVTAEAVFEAADELVRDRAPNSVPLI